MTRHATILLDALLRPDEAPRLDGPMWNRLLRVARKAKLVAKLAVRIEDAGVMDLLEPRVRDHLLAAQVVAAQHNRTASWDVNRIRRALWVTGIDFVLLKGAAYTLAQLPPARGRLVSDVDIMVPKPRIADAERALLAAGWAPMKLDAYDQRYYRRWMHELPPLQHKARQTVLDVHHTILPETGRLHPDADKLFDAARPLNSSPSQGEVGRGSERTKSPNAPSSRLAGDMAHAHDKTTSNALTLPQPLPKRVGSFAPRVLVLCPADMVLHSAAHLFQDGDLAGGLRDLIDMDELLRHFAKTEQNFWHHLVARGREMDLHRPLYYALRFTQRLLNTPVPSDVMAAAAASGKPRWPAGPIMDALATRALIPETDDRFVPGAGAARFVLYARSHWLRMPPLMLAQHLSRKALRRFGRKDAPAAKTKPEQQAEKKRVA